MGDRPKLNIKNARNVNAGRDGQAGDIHHYYAVQPDESSRSDLPAPEVPLERRVFVVHGRDDEARSAVFDLLRALGLQPWEWGQMVADLGQTAPFNGQVVAHGMERAQATVVLLTPDDIAYLHPDLHHGVEPKHERQCTGQPRANVLIELGMALMAAEDRTIIVEFGKLRPAADITGRNVVQFHGSDSSSHAAINRLVARLRTAGCQVDTQGADWSSLRRFSELQAYRRRPVPAMEDD